MVLKIKFSKLSFLIIVTGLLMVSAILLSGLLYFTVPSNIFADTATTDTAQVTSKDSLPDTVTDTAKDSTLDNTYGPTGSLKLSPESGTLGNTLSIEGDGFKPKEQVDIYLYKSESEKILVKSLIADDSGEITLVFFNPLNIGAGPYKIVAEGSDKVLWADYYVTSERRFSVLTFIFSIAAAFVTGAGIMFLIMRRVYRKYLPKPIVKP